MCKIEELASPPWMLGAPFDSSEDACERNAAAAAKYAWPFANCKLILSAFDAASWRACFAWGVGKTQKKHTYLQRQEVTGPPVPY